MTSIATALLALALQLLLAVQGGVGITDAQKENAVSVANYAIKTALQAINGTSSASSASSSAAATSTAVSSTVATSTSASTAAATSTPPSVAIALLSNNVISISPSVNRQDIASFIFSAGSESVNISTTTITLGAAADASFENIRLLVNRSQWGTTVASSTSGAAYSFGSSYPFTIPANGTVRVDVNADVFATAIGMNPAASLTSCSGAGAVSGTAVSCSALAGEALAVGTATLSANSNSAVADATATISRPTQRISSFILAASRAEPVNVNSLTVSLGNGSGYANMKLYVSGSQFGGTQSQLSSGGSYQFSGPFFGVAAGSTSTIVDVYADVLSGATAMSPAAIFSACSGFGAYSGNYVTCGGTAVGQNLAVTE